MPQCQSGRSSKSSKPLVRAMEVSDEQALLNKNGSGIGRECGVTPQVRHFKTGVLRAP